jgi:two-component sensor histidine kinase
MTFTDRAELERLHEHVRALMDENARLVKEKDILAAETNHRIKNTLMQASALLMTEAQRKPEIAEILLSIQHHMEAMAAIHDLLSVAKDANAIDLGACLEPLVPKLLPPTFLVTLEARVERGILVHPAICQPMVMIAVELVTNAMKHAFPEHRPGSVRVEFNHAGEDKINLTVSDDGVGMPGVVRESLGYRVVRSLVAQIEGTLNLSSGSQGTTVQVIAPASRPGTPGRACAVP